MKGSRGRSHGCGPGGGPRSSTFNSQGRRLLPFNQCNGNTNSFHLDFDCQNQGKKESSRDTRYQTFQNSKNKNFKKDPRLSTQASSKNSHSNNLPAQGFCQICGKPNHSAQKCWWRNDIHIMKKNF